MTDACAKEYKGFWFHPDTPDKLCDVLINLRNNRTRIRLDYGDTVTGRSWQEVYDVAGYIGNSTGPHKILILVNNSRSSGGGAILTHCILSVKLSTKPHTVLYELERQ